MGGKLQFREKLSGIVELGNDKNRMLTTEDVEKYFEEDRLSEEQMALVYDYLLTQRIAVVGYEKKGGTILTEEEKEEKLSPQERMYVEEYLEEISTLRPQNKSEEKLKYYSPKVVDIAIELYNEECMLEDLIQEGNVGLMMSLEPEVLSEQQILANIRQAMQMILEENEEVKSHDRKMIEKVEYLNECVKRLTEELQRKPALDELAAYMELTEDEVNDILRLTGEDEDDETDGDDEDDEDIIES